MALLQTLSDPFNNGSIDGALWSTFTDQGATVVETTALTFTPAAATANSQGLLFSNTTYDLTSSYGLVQVNTVCTGNVTNFYTLKLDNDNEVQFQVVGGNLNAHRKIATVEGDYASIPYNGTTQKWWRFSSTGGNLIYDYSADGLSWTNLATTANPFAVTSLQVLFGVYEFGSTATPGTFSVNNFNIPPTPATTGQGGRGLSIKSLQNLMNIATI